MVGDKGLVAISSVCQKTEPRGTVNLAMSVFCFLCNADISHGSMKTKRKRLSGASNKKAVEVLDIFFLPLNTSKASGRIP